jgi:flavodoxin
MKTVIVYYSLSNNTKAAAEVLSEKLQAELVELKEEKVGNVFQAIFRKRTTLLGSPWDIAGEADRLYLMFPIWASKAVPAMNAFVRDPKANFQKKEVYIITFQASPDFKNSVKVHDYIGNFVRKGGGIVKQTYAMQGGNMNVFIGDDKIRERMERVRWDEL